MEKSSFDSNERPVETPDSIHLSRNEFFTQYNREHVLDLNGEKLTYHVAEPRDPISDRWVVYVGGFGTGPKIYQNELCNLAQSGRKVLFVNPLHGIPNEDCPLPQDVPIPQTIQHKAHAVAALLRTLKLGTVDMVGQSQGGAVATVVELLYPGTTQQLVLDAPAGMYAGEDSGFSVSTRTIADTVQQISRIPTALREKGLPRVSRDISDSLTTAAQEWSKDPAWRIQKEIPGVIATDLVPMLAALRTRRDQTQDSTQEITLLHGNRDMVFPPDHYEHSLSKLANQESVEVTSEHPAFALIDHWVMYADKEAGHTAAMYEEPGLLKQILNKRIPGRHR